MALNLTPPHWLTTYSAAGSACTITPPNLSSGDASASTGDIREVMYRISDDLYTHWKTIKDAAVVADPLPSNMNVTKSISYNSGNNTYTTTYGLSFTTAVLTSAVVDEA